MSAQNGLILAIDAAGPRAGVALTDEAGAPSVRLVAEARTGLTEILPQLMASALARVDVAPALVAVTVGPGSFTGLRSAIAVAQGYAAATGLPLWGVNVGEAFNAAFPMPHRPLWIAIRARRGRIFLIRDGVAEAFADADVPGIATPIALAGDAAKEVAARLAATGHDVLLTNARLVDPIWVARAALARRAAGLPAHPAQPVY